MKVCKKCGWQGTNEDNYCVKCGAVMEFMNDNYSGVFQTQAEKDKLKISRFPFVTKLVVGILAMLSISVFKLGGIECILLGIIGGICSISMCAWNNEWSGYIPAIIFLLCGLVFSGGHPLLQIVCIIYIGLELAASIKIKKQKR